MSVFEYVLCSFDRREFQFFRGHAKYLTLYNPMVKDHLMFEK